MRISPGLCLVVAGIVTSCGDAPDLTDAGSVHGAALSQLAPVSHTITVLRLHDGAGTVSSPGGIACGATCTATFPDGTVVVLTAVPDPGSTFTG